MRPLRRDHEPQQGGDPKAARDAATCKTGPKVVAGKAILAPLTVEEHGVFLLHFLPLMVEAIEIIARQRHGQPPDSGKRRRNTLEHATLKVVALQRRERAAARDSRRLKREGSVKRAIAQPAE